MFRSTGRLTPAQQHAIEQIVGHERARFDVRERRIYSHDTSVLPTSLRLVAGRSLADGVVRPSNEEQLIRLVQLAHAEQISLVPRGKGTSGYGGAVPTRGGLLLDLSGLKGISRCNPATATATVGAGTVWQDLEAHLAEWGLAPRLYPSSAPSSTVGGWLAQGGAGIGSHAYGWFAENVTRARIVTGTGEARELVDDQLAGVADAEGTTGIITELTLRVRPSGRVAHVALSWYEPQQVADALKLVTDAGLPVWSIHVTNPTSAKLKNASPRHDLAGAARVSLPENCYTAVFVYAHDDVAAVTGRLTDIGRDTDAKWLSDRTAQYLWSERFKPMRSKRLGPSLIPVEVVVPTSQFAPVFSELEQRLSTPVAFEALSVRGNEMVLLGLIPHDERTAAYTFGYGFALSGIQVAEQHGGRAYSTGRYFGGRANQILGNRKIRVLESAKQENDPAGVLNPGKVIFGEDALRRVVGLATSAEPLLRGAANLFGRPAPPMERVAPNKRLPPDAAGYAYACAQCGYCVDVCPQFQQDGWESSSPRGKWFLLKGVLETSEQFDNQLRDIFGLCTHCGKCDEVCQIDLPIEPSWRKVKGALFDGILTRTS
jgi:FAD/FMN-containing dehydrogenase/ferredoxin